MEKTAMFRDISKVSSKIKNMSLQTGVIKIIFQWNNKKNFTKLLKNYYFMSESE